MLQDVFEMPETLLKRDDIKAQFLAMSQKALNFLFGVTKPIGNQGMRRFLRSSEESVDGIH